MTGGKSSFDDRTSRGDRRVLGECPPDWGAMPAAAKFDSRVAEMRALLVRVRPASDAEALRCLRSAFPDASLEARVAAISALRG